MPLYVEQSVCASACWPTAMLTAATTKSAEERVISSALRMSQRPAFDSIEALPSASSCSLSCVPVVLCGVPSLAWVS